MGVLIKIAPEYNLAQSCFLPPAACTRMMPLAPVQAEFICLWQHDQPINRSEGFKRWPIDKALNGNVPTGTLEPARTAGDGEGFHYRERSGRCGELPLAGSLCKESRPISRDKCGKVSG